jgi:hypothetical protein
MKPIRAPAVRHASSTPTDCLISDPVTGLVKWKSAAMK